MHDAYNNEGIRHLFQLNSCSIFINPNIGFGSVQFRSPETDISPVDRERTRALLDCLQLLISNPTVHDTGASDVKKLDL